MSVDEKVQNQVRAFLAKAKGEASGWTTVVHNPEVLKEKAVYLYVVDYPTGWTWMVAVPLTHYVKGSLQAAQGTPEFIEAARSGCASLISDAADERPIQSIGGLSWEEQLGAALIFYSGTTRVWQLADRLCRGGHFVVIYYRDPGAKTGKLRPFAFPDNDDCPVSHDMLLSAVSEVVSMDFKAHPDWIPKD